MKTNGYFNNLEKYWSANFLALISFTNLVVSIITTLIYTISYFIKSITFTGFGQSHHFNIVEAFMMHNVSLYSVCCCLVACFAILYILILYFPKRITTIISTALTLIIFCVFFYQYYQFEESMWTGGAIFTIVFLFSNLITIPLTFVIYFILLLFEIIPRFRVPETIISQNILFKKFINCFYWYYFIMLILMLFFTVHFIIF